MVDRGDAHIEVIAEGAGPIIVILPSLGRSADDYDVVAALLAKDGFRVLRPQPRGIGASTGPMTGLTLHDFAADIAAVIEHEGKGPVVVVGHAYGHFVARTLATDRPELVRGVVLAAASAGKVPPGVHEPSVSPEVREAIEKSGDLSLTEADRLRYLQFAFFAPGTRSARLAHRLAPRNREGGKRSLARHASRSMVRVRHNPNPRPASRKRRSRPAQICRRPEGRARRSRHRRRDPQRRPRPRPRATRSHGQRRRFIRAHSPISLPSFVFRNRGSIRRSCATF